MLCGLHAPKIFVQNGMLSWIWNIINKIIAVESEIKTKPNHNTANGFNKIDISGRRSLLYRMRVCIAIIYGWMMILVHVPRKRNVCIGSYAGHKCVYIWWIRYNVLCACGLIEFPEWLHSPSARQKSAWNVRKERMFWIGDFHIPKQNPHGSRYVCYLM